VEIECPKFTEDDLQVLALVYGKCSGFMRWVLMNKFRAEGEPPLPVKLYCGYSYRMNVVLYRKFLQCFRARYIDTPRPNGEHLDYDAAVRDCLTQYNKS
jgi:hypothetical protein